MYLLDLLFFVVVGNYSLRAKSNGLVCVDRPPRNFLNIVIISASYLLGMSHSMSLLDSSFVLMTLRPLEARVSVMTDGKNVLSYLKSQALI